MKILERRNCMKPLGLKIKDDKAYLHNYKLDDLAKQYSTPLYVLDEEDINNRLDLFLNNFKGVNFKSTIVYASKALLLPYLAKMVNNKGLSMDAVSIGDLYIAEKSGFNTQNIVFHGNNKQVEELVFAIDNKVGLIVVDNLFELKLLDKLLKEKNAKANILIRVNPGIDAHTHIYIQTSKLTSKFGESIYDQNIIEEIIKIVKSSNDINMLGFHAHIGSQIHETSSYLVEIDKMIDFQNEIAIKYNLDLPVINLGGGFGIKYFKEEQNTPLNEMLAKMSKKIDDKLTQTKTTIKEVMIEPGRSIIGPAGITLYTCSQIKHTYGGKNYLFIDGGMTDNIRPALYDARYECDIVTKMNDEKNILVDVVGKCCESGDIIRKDVLVPKIENGDVLMVYATGAYNYSMSSNYNSHLKPAVIMIGNDVKVISRRETLDDLMKLF